MRLMVMNYFRVGAGCPSMRLAGADSRFGRDFEVDLPAVLWLLDDAVRSAFAHRWMKIYSCARINCRCRTIASLYVGVDIQGDVSSIRSPLALPVPSSYTSAFTHPSSVAAKKVFFSACIDPHALPVPFFSTRALQRQRCEGHASSRGTGSVYEAGRSLGGAPAAPKRWRFDTALQRGWAAMAVSEREED